MELQTKTTSVSSIFRYGSFLIAIGLLATVIWFLAGDFARKVDVLARAQSDNMQWSLSQVEVEFLLLEHALQYAEVDGEDALPEVRRQFDIFYSRINTLRTSALYAELRNDPEFAPLLAAIWGTIQDTVALIDGSDDRLLSQAAMLEDRFGGIHDQVRSMALKGLSFFVERQGASRNSIADTLNRAAAITLVTIFVLVLTLGVLWRSFAVSRSHAADARISAERMTAVVTTALDAVVVSDKTGRILEFNGGAEEIFGYRRDEVMGRTISDVMVPDAHREAHHAGMERYLNTGQKKVIGKGRVKLEAERKDGTLFPVELSLSATTRKDGEEIFVAFLRDITNRVATEQALLEARDTAQAGERAKAELLAVMSHEMRTPLNGMLGTLELLEDTDLSARQRKYLSVINKSGQILLHHVNDVLDISRLDSGKMGIEQRSLDLSEIVQDVVDSQLSLAEAAGNSIDVALLPPDKSMVLGDAIRLRQIMMNLVGNAVKFTQNGAIHVSVDRLGYDNMVEISVADTGIGIAPHDKDRVFSDFVTLDTTYDRKNTGTGLGLGIASRMTTAMGGEIGVESEPGEGSLFWVRLPLPPAPISDMPGIDLSSPLPLIPEPERAPAPDIDPLEILVVEDNEINRLVVREMLEKAGHKVAEAMDGQEGVDAARIKQYDLILMDISMPRMDGVEATRLIRSEGGASARAPIVALTAHALLEEVSRFKAVGMDHTLTKPISRKTLQIALDLAQGQGVPLEDGTTAPVSRRSPARVRVEGDPVDTERLATMSGEVGAERMAKLLDAFVKEADVSVAKIAALKPGAEPPDVLAQIHQLAGSAAIFGAKSLHAWLQDMEARGKSGEMDAVFAELSEISAIWITTRSRIGELKDIRTRA